MADGFGLGGNLYASSFQLTMTGTAIALPTVAETTATGFGVIAVVHVAAPAAADVFIGPAGVTTTTGFRILQNTTHTFYTRYPLYAVGASGVVTGLLETN